MRSSTTVGDSAVKRCRLPSLGDSSQEGLAAVTAASHTMRARIVAALVEVDGVSEST